MPMLVRWPGKIKPSQISNEIVQHHDWFPTFLAMAGDPDVGCRSRQACHAARLRVGHQAPSQGRVSRFGAERPTSTPDGIGQGQQEIGEEKKQHRGDDCLSVMGKVRDGKSNCEAGVTR